MSEVEFGGIQAVFRTSGSETIVATAPDSPSGAKVAAVTVVNAHGSSAPSGSAVYRYVLPPSGYWLAAADGGIFTYGGAGFHGSTGGRILDRTRRRDRSPPRRRRLLARRVATVVCSASATPTYHGSMGGRHLNAPIVGMAATPDGGGYWLVAVGRRDLQLRRRRLTTARWAAGT